MAKEKNATVTPFVRELFQFGLYKRSQGRIARQVTFAALAVVILLAAWRSAIVLGNGKFFLVPGLEVPLRTVPWLLLPVGLWIAYRLVNLPTFADFLIAVEAEMNKVSWPTRSELIRSAIVVIFSIFFLALVLFGYDMFWRFLLDAIEVTHR